MVELSRPFTGTVTGDAGPYSAAQWAEVWQYMETYQDGVLSGVLNELRVIASTPAARSVDVSTGAGVVRGRFYSNDAALTLTLAVNASGSTRYDRIVLEVNYAAQTVRAVVVQGIPAAGVPALTQVAGTLWQHELAVITCANGYATITAAEIRDERTAWANTPGDALTNQAVARIPGDVMIVDTGNDDSMTTTTTASDGRIIGSIMENTVNTGIGRLAGLKTGIFYSTGAVTRGRLQAAGGVAGQTVQAQSAAFIQALEASVGAGYYRGLILPRPVGPFVSIFHVGGNYTTAGAAFADIDGAGTTLDMVIVTRGGPVFVGIVGTIFNNTNTTIASFEILADGANFTGTAGGGVGSLSTVTANARYTVNFHAIVPGLAPGTHTFKPQWATSGGTLTMYGGADAPIILFAYEF